MLQEHCTTSCWCFSVKVAGHSVSRDMPGCFDGPCFPNMQGNCAGHQLVRMLCFSACPALMEVPAVTANPTPYAQLTLQVAEQNVHATKQAQPV
jgi:hypothetical protein